MSDFGLCTGLKKAHRTDYYKEFKSIDPSEGEGRGGVGIMCEGVEGRRGEEGRGGERRGGDDVGGSGGR